MMAALAVVLASTTSDRGLAQPTGSSTAGLQSGRNAPTSVLRRYFELVESPRMMEISTEEFLRATSEATAAEAAIEAWPADLPDRKTFQALLAFYSRAGGMAGAMMSNQRSGANMSDVFEVVNNAARDIDYKQAPHSWAYAQVLMVEVVSAMLPFVVQLAPPDQRLSAATNFAQKIEGLLKTPERFPPQIQIVLLQAMAENYFRVEAIPSPEGHRLGLAALERARKAALANHLYDQARVLAADEAEALLWPDPTGGASVARLEALTSLGPTQWLDRRSIFALRAKLAEKQRNTDGVRFWSDRWLAALAEDLEAAKVPFWAAEVSSEDQYRFLSASLTTGNIGAALARFDRLSALVATPGQGYFGVPPEVSSGAEAAGTRPLTIDLTALGVDIVIAAAPRGSVSPKVGNGPWAIPTDIAEGALTLDWAAARRKATAAGASSIVHPYVALIELSRGAASQPSAIARMFSANPAAPAEFSAVIAKAQAEAAPQAENRFWDAFGKPIDTLSGGRCAADQPLTGPVPRVLVILPARLSFFPFEMALAPNGRRLIDCYEFRRAPTLAAAMRSAGRWKSAQRPGHISGLWNPGGDLVGAAAERALVTAAVGGSGRVSKLDITTIATILEPGGSNIIHLSTHGRFDALDPFESGVTLGVGRTLSFRDIASAKMSSPALLAVLPACEVGLSNPESGEIAYWGVSSALLDAGVGGVVGALWQVHDDAAALIMAKFYELVFRDGRSPAAAIRGAQLWLRGARADEIQSMIDASLSKADPTAQTALARLSSVVSARASADPGHPPYADPMYWGGFGYFGS